MTQFEYRVVFDAEGRSAEGLTEWLDGLGSSGWELVAVVEYRYFFKRAIPYAI